MQIAWVVPGAFDQQTGGYLYDRLIVEGLRASGDHVRIVCLAAGTDTEALVRAISDDGPDVVVGDALAAPELGAAFVRLGELAARVLLVHHLTSWEDDVDDREARRNEEASAVRASDWLIATSPATSRRLAHEHGRVADAVAPGADRLPPPATRGARATRHEEDVALLFVGSLLPRKRLPLLLEVLDHLAAPRTSLRIVGDLARDAQHARSIEGLLARSPYLSEHVAVLGAVDDGALAQELDRADALVLPSSLEGYGMVLTEALHAGVPVIAARAWAPPEVSEGPEVALLFDGFDGLLASLRRFAGDPRLREGMRQAAVDRRASLPTWKGASSRFRDALTRAARREARAPWIGPAR